VSFCVVPQLLLVVCSFAFGHGYLVSASRLTRAAALVLGLLTLVMLSTLCLWFVIGMSFCVCCD
jgi:hypothetical protein